ncbi:teicoplanin resistance protein VanZ [Seonamhaeicola algicola]|uniref:Teicoplanin resistance protein VanZ n=2 Tax=Seonamhaeicola algicola TaxID=1719036 RepID=A0A5C7ACH6_9FLAO|nr:teicoplanin resistance protein VanZ [Seonamhaeicola algicola]
MLKKVILPVAICYTVFLTAVSLMRLNNLPEVNISFADKIFHFGAYAALTTVWFYSLLLHFKLKFKASIIYAAVFAVIFGIIIEVLQQTLTAYRALDVYDALANTLGALLATTAIWFTKSLHIKNL